MSTPLRKFTGFKGVCAFAQIGEVQFAILAASQRQIEILWAGILTEAGPLDPAGCKRAILIEQATLPDSPAAVSPQSGQQQKSDADLPDPLIPHIDV